MRRVLLIACCLATLAAAPAVAQAATIPPPSSDAFYAAPANLASLAPGAVIRSRKVSLPGLWAHSYQLLYRTTNATGAPVAAATTLLVPGLPASGPRKLVSYQTAEDSLTTRCAPSYTLRTGTVGIEGAAIGLLVDNGWDVVVPDYEGPRSEYAVGPLEGRATLDSIRAVESFEDAGLEGAKTPVGTMGYSGGSIPSIWANALQPAYAPELDVVAATAGGMAPDAKQVLAAADGGPAFGEIIAAGIGIDRAYPKFDLDAKLNARGRALEHRDATDAGGCGSAIASAPFGKGSEYTKYSGVQELLAQPNVKRILAKLNLITRPAPTAATFYFHEIGDEFVPIKPVDEMVVAYCRQGATIDYVRGLFGEHLIGSAAYFSRAVGYLHARFAGRPAPNTCPS
jgi:hypothetical protein